MNCFPAGRKPCFGRLLKADLAAALPSGSRGKSRTRAR
jgi:hypothetical protein